MSEQKKKKPRCIVLATDIQYRALDIYLSVFSHQSTSLIALVTTDKQDGSLWMMEHFFSLSGLILLLSSSSFWILSLFSSFTIRSAISHSQLTRLKTENTTHFLSISNKKSNCSFLTKCRWTSPFKCCHLVRPVNNSISRCFTLISTITVILLLQG